MSLPPPDAHAVLQYFATRLRHLSAVCLIMVWTGAPLATAMAQAPTSQHIDTATVIGRRAADQMPLTSFIAAEAAFQADHGHAPEATLRFQILPRDAAVPTASIRLTLEDAHASPPMVPIAIVLADDASFVLPRIDSRRFSDDAMVRSNLPEHSLHWRPLVRSPDQGDDVRRLGDLRLECEAKEAGQLNRPDLPFFARIFVTSDVSECASDDEHFFIAPKALTTVTLEFGARRVEIEPNRIAEASQGDLLPRSYHVFEDGWEARAFSPPLGDASWPDDTVVQFHFAPVEPATPN